MTRLLFVVVALLVSMAPIGAARQDSMAAARELYATAAYDEALAMLDRLRGATPAPATADARTIEQFRAYSLFALGRAADAEKAVEAVVTIDPTWEIADTEAPPRIVALFANVRARALPNLVRERFDAAKALHAEKKYRRGDQRLHPPADAARAAVGGQGVGARPRESADRRVRVPGSLEGGGRAGAPRGDAASAAPAGRASPFGSARQRDREQWRTLESR